MLIAELDRIERNTPIGVGLIWNLIDGLPFMHPPVARRTNHS